MNGLRKIPESEYTRRIYRENAYIILSALCALSNSMNLSENTREICRDTQDRLSEEIGDEEFKVNVRQ